MKERIWTFMDKKAWGPGPWQDEPDKIQYPDPETGLPCLAVRNTLGSWCGYVGVLPGHKFYGLDYNTCSADRGCKDEGYFCEHTPDSILEVHGGVTFSDFCQERTEGDEHYKSVCHVTEPGEEDRVWWIGYDTAHCQDLVPGMKRFAYLGGIYRTLDYIKAQNAKLAGQLAAMQPKPEKPIRVFRNRREE
jgi:hypothetical protein